MTSQQSTFGNAFPERLLPRTLPDDFVTYSYDTDSPTTPHLLPEDYYYYYNYDDYDITDPRIKNPQIYEKLNKIENPQMSNELIDISNFSNTFQETKLNSKEMLNIAVKSDNKIPMSSILLKSVPNLASVFHIDTIDNSFNNNCSGNSCDNDSDEIANLNNWYYKNFTDSSDEINIKKDRNINLSLINKPLLRPINRTIPSTSVISWSNTNQKCADNFTIFYCMILCCIVNYYVKKNPVSEQC